MAFGIIKKSSLPVVSIGRSATEPKVGVAENGRLVLNSIISKAVGDIDRVLLGYDPDSNKVAVIGLVKGAALPKGYAAEDVFAVKTDAGGQKSIGASGFLRSINYDYAKAGSHSYAAVLNEKMMKECKAYIIELPKVTPERRPVTPRKPKVVQVPAAIANGTAQGTLPGTVAAPQDEELVMEG